MSVADVGDVGREREEEEEAEAGADWGWEREAAGTKCGGGCTLDTTPDPAFRGERETR